MIGFYLQVGALSIKRYLQTRPDADTDTNQGQHARMSRTCPGACCAFYDSFCVSATLRRLVRESERCAVF